MKLKVLQKQTRFLLVILALYWIRAF